MKAAALEAWGTDSNLFHQGCAKEAVDPKVIAVTMAKPGIVLKRPVGTKGTFSENAHLPTSLPATAPRSKLEEPPKKPKTPSSSKIDDKKAREAASGMRKKNVSANECGKRKKSRKRNNGRGGSMRSIKPKPHSMTRNGTMRHA